MPLINPIFGLPSSAVDRVAEKEEKKKRREKGDDKDSLRQSRHNAEENDREGLVPEPEELPVSQILDTNTIVKLIEAHLECQKIQEHSPSSATSLYNHVKNITQTSVYTRTV